MWFGSKKSKHKNRSNIITNSIKTLNKTREVMLGLKPLIPPPPKICKDVKWGWISEHSCSILNGTKESFLKSHLVIQPVSLSIYWEAVIRSRNSARCFPTHHLSTIRWGRNDLSTTRMRKLRLQRLKDLPRATKLNKRSHGAWKYAFISDS